MKGFVDNIERITERNDDFRRVLYTGKHLQLVVMALMAEGRTNAAIAAQLEIGTGAVEKNVTSIFQKLGLDDSGTDHRRVLAVLAWLQR